jgi:hypothetical protein
MTRYTVKAFYDKDSYIGQNIEPKNYAKRIRKHDKMLID